MIEGKRPSRQARLIKSDQPDVGILVRAGLVGEFRCRLRVGEGIGAGSCLGRVDILSKAYDLKLADDAPFAQVAEVLLAIGLVDYETPILRLRTALESEVETRSASPGSAQALAIRAAQPGRVYLRPSPQEPPYIQVGDELKTGQTVLLTEIMKTFTPLHYPGAAAGLPDRARVKAILIADLAEVEAGTALIELEMP